MPLWESNEIYFVAGLSVLVTLGAFASLAYFVYRRAVTNGRRASEEQAALEKVLIRKETVTTGPPTKPLIVSPSFSSPNKVPARHLRSGSYSPTHYLSPYHSRQPRRNSSPTSQLSPSVSYQAKLQPPQLVLHHPQLEEEEIVEADGNYLQQGNGNGSISEETCTSTSSNSSSPIQSTGNNGSKNETNGSMTETRSHAHPTPPKIKNNKEQQRTSHQKRGSSILAHHNSQYYGTIPPRRSGTAPPSGSASRHHGKAGVAPAETNLFGHALQKCASGAVLAPHPKHNTFIKEEYIQLPGKDGGEAYQDIVEEDEEESCKRKERITNSKGKNCSADKMEQDYNDGGLRRKLVLQKQFLQQQQHKLSKSAEAPGELFKMKHSVTEEIPYYITSQ